jgi:hypothetical protein
MEHEDRMFYNFIDLNLIKLLSFGKCGKLRKNKLKYIVIPFLSHNKKLYKRFKEYIETQYEYLDIKCLDDFPKEYNLKDYIKDVTFDNILFQDIKVETRNDIMSKISTYRVYYM